MLNLPYCHADPFPEEPTGIEGTDAKGKAYGGRLMRQPGDKDYEDYKDTPMRHDKTIERNQQELRVGTLADVAAGIGIKYSGDERGQPWILISRARLAPCLNVRTREGI